MREDRLAVAHDRADQRACHRQFAERRADKLALVAHGDVEHLEAVALEHGELADARVVREADDLLGGHRARVDGDVDAGLLEDLLPRAGSWTIAIVNWTPCSFASVAA